jgi:hypothetical protein
MPNIASALAAIGAALIGWNASAIDLEAYKKALAAGDPAPLIAAVRADAGRTPLDQATPRRKWYAR